MTKDTERASTQPAPLGKPGGPGLFHKKRQGLPVYIENIRNALIRKGHDESSATAIAIATVKKLAATSKDPAVKLAAGKAVLQWEKAKASTHVHASEPIELAQPQDGHHLAGVVTYRYRHGWILLHPEVPSRGKRGGAHAATIHHKSGGTTVGHFEHGGAGGYGATHAKFIPDKHFGPGEDHTAHLKDAMSAGVGHKPHADDFEAAHAKLYAQHEENLAKLKHAAKQAHLKAMEPYATSYMHQDAIDALGAVVDEAGPGHKDAIIAAKTALLHQKLKFKTPGAEFVKSDAHKAAMASDSFAYDEGTVSAHQNAALAHHNAMLKANSMHADSWVSGHKQAKEEHEAKVEELKQKDAAKLSLKASVATASANTENRPAAHKAAALVHEMAAQKHFELDNHDAVAFHDKQVAIHAAAAKSVSGNAPSYPKYSKAAAIASAKANNSGFKEDHEAAAEAHELAMHKTAKGSPEGKKHFAAMGLHGMVAGSASSKGKAGDIDEDIAKMEALGKKMNSPQGTSADEDAFVAAGKTFKEKHGQPFHEAKQNAASGAADDKKMAALFKNMLAANASNDPNQPAVVNKMINAQAEYKKIHGNTWAAAISPAMGYKPPDSGSGIGAGAEISKPGTTDYTHSFPGAKEAGYHAVAKSTSANGSWKPSQDDEGGGVYDYSGSVYTQINDQLRTGKIDEYDDDQSYTIERMDQQFKSAPALTEPIVVSRWLGTGSMFGPNPPGASAGDEFVDKAFGSTSKDPEIWSSGKGAQVQVRIPAGMKALDLNHTFGSLNPQEAEILLPRGTRYRVVSDTGQVPNRKIVVEVVAQDPSGSVGG